jgi:hypothetical protein
VICRAGQRLGEQVWWEHRTSSEVLCSLPKDGFKEVRLGQSADSFRVTLIAFYREVRFRNKVRMSTMLRRAFEQAEVQLLVGDCSGRPLGAPQVVQVGVNLS